MTNGLILAFLFFIGSLTGWCLEFAFRNLISHKGPKMGFVINPGFCKGPYLPIYGVGVSVMFVISYFLTPDKGVAPVWVIILGIGICMSLIELIGGWFLLNFLNMRLWDYSHFPGNIKGYICPQFSLIWMTLGAIYYLLIHPLVIDGLIWLSKNLAFSFMIGLFFGFFIVDFMISSRDARVVKEFADDYDVIVKYDELKALIQQRRLEKSQSATFFNQISMNDRGLMESLKESFNENLREHLPESLKESLKEHLPESIREHLPEHMSDSLRENLREHLPENVKENVREHIHEYMEAFETKTKKFHKKKK